MSGRTWWAVHGQQMLACKQCRATASIDTLGADTVAIWHKHVDTGANIGLTAGCSAESWYVQGNNITVCCCTDHMDGPYNATPLQVPLLVPEAAPVGRAVGVEESVMALSNSVPSRPLGAAPLLVLLRCVAVCGCGTRSWPCWWLLLAAASLCWAPACGCGGCVPAGCAAGVGPGAFSAALSPVAAAVAGACVAAVLAAPAERPAVPSPAAAAAGAATTVLEPLADGPVAASPCCCCVLDSPGPAAGGKGAAGAWPVLTAPEGPAAAGVCAGGCCCCCCCTACCSC